MQRYIKKTNHTSLCDTSLCDTSLFYVLLTRSISIVTTRHPCLLDEHQSLCEQAIQFHMNSKCCVRLCGFTSNVVPKARNQKYQASLIGQRLVGFLQLAYNRTNTTASCISHWYVKSLWQQETPGAYPFFSLQLLPRFLYLTHQHISLLIQLRQFAVYLVHTLCHY